MDSISHLRRMFDHVFWADERVLEALRPAPEPEPRALTLLAHLLAAEQVWFARIAGEDSSAIPIWPSLSTAACVALAEENRRRYAAYLDALTPGELERAADYRNSAGIAFRTPIHDILTHVALHGAYHRGQVAQALRLAGAEPVNTDYITWVRTAAPAAA